MVDWFGVHQPDMLTSNKYPLGRLRKKKIHFGMIKKINDKTGSIENGYIGYGQNQIIYFRRKELMLTEAQDRWTVFDKIVVFNMQKHPNFEKDEARNIIYLRDYLEYVPIDEAKQFLRQHVRECTEYCGMEQLAVQIPERYHSFVEGDKLVYFMPMAGFERYGELKTQEMIANDLYIFQRDSGYGLIQGPVPEVLIQPICESIKPCKKNVLLLEVVQNGKCGIYTHSGEAVIPCKYDYAQLWSKDVAIVGKKGKNLANQMKYGMIRTDGQEEVPVEFDEIFEIQNQLFCLRQRSELYLHRRYSRFESSRPYEEISIFLDQYVKAKHNGLYGILNLHTEEQLVIPFIYEDIQLNGLEGLIKVKKNGLFGVIDMQSNEMLPCIYEDLDDFHTPLFIIRKNGLYGAVNVKTKEFIPCSYESLKKISGTTLFSVRKQGKHGVIDNDNQLVLPYEYDADMFYYSDTDYIQIRNNGKYGFATSRGHVFVPAIHESYKIISDLIFVKKGSNWGVYKDQKLFIDYIFENAGKQIKVVSTSWRSFRDGLDPSIGPLTGDAFVEYQGKLYEMDANDGRLFARDDKKNNYYF